MSPLKENRMEDGQENLRQKPSLALVGLLTVQIIIGYEWLISGIAKFASGSFPSGLADQLTDAAKSASGGYASFLRSFVIPNATAFGYIIETAEVLVGIALIVGPLIWIFAWNRIPDGLRTTTLALMIAASLGGVFMALNFHLASGTHHPWVIPDSPFDEGVDLDALLSALQLAVTAVQIAVLSRLLQEKAAPAVVASPANPSSLYESQRP